MKLEISIDFLAHKGSRFMLTCKTKNGIYW